MFQTTKIQTFESNSQQSKKSSDRKGGCFKLQRYKLLKAIHNLIASRVSRTVLFQTTKIQTFESNSQRLPSCTSLPVRCFKLQRYKLLKAIHNKAGTFPRESYVVSNYKDTNFWKQFTTLSLGVKQNSSLFQTTKIQTFESNSQPPSAKGGMLRRCFKLQRYKLLKAIHNNPVPPHTTHWLFQTTKIQTFESNSQRPCSRTRRPPRCFKLQRYKLLKAIHNCPQVASLPVAVVSNYKDTNFWKQFTTKFLDVSNAATLFQTTKIQTFESNSQPPRVRPISRLCCFKLQRYKLLKAIHNDIQARVERTVVVSNYKDTNFWKQFTTL